MYMYMHVHVHVHYVHVHVHVTVMAETVVIPEAGLMTQIMIPEQKRCSATSTQPNAQRGRTEHRI